MTNGAHTPHPEHKATAKDRLLQTIAILGLIAVLLLGAWGIIQLAFNLPSIFSNVGGSISSIFNSTATSTSSTREGIAVTAPQTINSGDSFTLTWRHTGTAGQYGYTIAYSCASGVSIKAPLPNGTYQTVECNTPFNYTNAKDRTTLQASVTSAAPQKVTFTISAVRLSNNQVAVSGTASATVQMKGAAKPTTSGTNSTYYASGNTKNLYGLPDLAVTINSINSLSSYYGRTAVVFTVENRGSNVAFAGWTFDARLPIGNDYVYHSPIQQPLYPGDRIVYTLTFDDYNNDYRNDRDWDWDDEDYWNDDYRGYTYGGYPGGYGYNNSYYEGGRILITADPYNQILELNEANNTAGSY